MAEEVTSGELLGKGLRQFGDVLDFGSILFGSFKYRIYAIPLSHEKIDEWRDSLRGGITFKIDGSNIVITGGVVDVWVNHEG